MTSNLYHENYLEPDVAIGQREDKIVPSYTIREYNCSFDAQISSLISSKIESTLELAPANASTIVTITKQENNYRATMNISSYFASFESMAEGEDPYDNIKSICRDIRYQIHQWKKKRFENVTIGPGGYLQAV